MHNHDRRIESSRSIFNRMKDIYTSRDYNDQTVKIVYMIHDFRDRVPSLCGAEVLCSPRTTKALCSCFVGHNLLFSTDS
uniref:Uncharacterized protein n=1 Tax=Arion vulgaris TaxID=1028688 RepID=A0A0B6Y2R6_9EUPU